MKATFLLAALLLPGAASATEFEITYQANLIALFGNAPFGLPPSADVTVTYTLDTEAAPVVELPGAVWNGPTLYGYAASALTLPTITVGTATFTAADLQVRVPFSGYEAVVWFDAPLTVGATPRTWMLLSGSDGALSFGGGQCGSTCELTDQSSVSDNLIGDTSSGVVTVSVAEPPPQPQLELTLPYVVPGQTTLLSVHGATPGRRVSFGASLTRGSNVCPASLGGQCLGLRNPTLLGSAVANALGDAWLTVSVPNSLADGTTVHFQAAVPDGASSRLSPVVSLPAGLP